MSGSSSAAGVVRVGKGNGAKAAGKGGGAKAKGGGAHGHAHDGGGGMQRTAKGIARLLQLSARLPVIRTNEDLATVAAAVANVDREILFTTVSIDKPLHQLVFLRQWQGNLRSSAPHALMIGANNKTCEAARNATIPCFVDGAAPPLRGKQNLFGHQVLLKWWYAREMLRLNYHLMCGQLVSILPPHGRPIPVLPSLAVLTHVRVTPPPDSAASRTRTSPGWPTRFHIGSARTTSRG